ncbi:hypothetical protein [Pseudomonas sp. McL0111]|uniref:hypothetical protein n=1 Tax=Pseudomonas sp. McL0111 TaxID=3457357 RepID=UPI00403E865E
MSEANPDEGYESKCFALRTITTQPCGSGLAREEAISPSIKVTDPTPSLASQLPQVLPLRWGLNTIHDLRHHCPPIDGRHGLPMMEIKQTP